MRRAIEAYHSYAIDPRHFGFHLLITILSYVIFGGRNSVIGPLAGAAFLIVLPELARPLAENRMVIYGVMLILMINFMPKGVADTTPDAIKARRLNAKPRKAEAEAKS